MNKQTDYKKRLRANNDNYPPAHCIEVFDLTKGWVIYVDTGGRDIERMSIQDLFDRIWLIENAKHNRVYLDQAQDLRRCLYRIRAFEEGAA